MRLNGFLFILVCFILLFNACDNNRIYESYSHISNMGWNKDSVLNYSFHIQDTVTNYNLYFNLRNTVDYPFSNIWLFVSIASPESTVLTDTVEFMLADPSGRWFGQGHGKFRDNKLLFRNNIFFPDTGKYRIDVQQGMRNDVLKGVNDFGIRVEKIN
ncbi:MAG: gliding motility lipoprotein GldH [Prolixibacteraceae bacterium]|nr:gliding motility lipoprotein GldH [Prolixibacteraceae bacterium]MBN2773355.1 gliding motility lipoprotein GldH [Prolixibacteraceae bacterium]